MKTISDQILEYIELFNNEFMKPEILSGLTVSQIENSCGEVRWCEQGDEFLESDEYVTYTFKNVSLCRLSASGYLDCTEWDLCHDENDILEWISREALELNNEFLDCRFR